VSRGGITLAQSAGARRLASTAHFCDVVAPVATLAAARRPASVCTATNSSRPNITGASSSRLDFRQDHFRQPRTQWRNYTGKPRVFLESLGDNGFAPTACAVDPKTGDLYVSIGGAATRGAVYRIRHPSASRRCRQARAAADGETARWSGTTPCQEGIRAKDPVGVERDQLSAVADRPPAASFLGHDDVTSPFEQPLLRRPGWCAPPAPARRSVENVPPRHAAALKAIVKNDSRASHLERLAFCRATRRSP